MSQMSQNDESRFEFRAWAENLGEVEARLRRLAEPLQVRESGELYIVSTANDEANVKIRHGLLDIKVLAERRQALERWRAGPKRPFPLAAAVLGEEIMPALGVAPPRFARETYGLHDLLDEVVRPHPELLPVEVAKRRHGFTLDGCTAEFAEVAIRDVALQTAAVEAVDPAAVLAAMDRLALSGYDNICYPRAIKRVIARPP